MSATLWDKLLVLPKVEWILAKTFIAALTAPLRGENGAPTFGEHVRLAATREGTVTLNIAQMQWLVPSWVQTYKSWCKKNHVVEDVVEIPNSNGAQGFWLGKKEMAKYTLVFFHGGGFVVSGTSMHLELLLRLIKWSDNQIAIFAVAYALSPQVLYPTAIGQSVEGLRYVLSLPGHSPDTTLLGGDSAGGALVMAVLSHLSHPHPQKDLVKPLSLDTDLKGAFVIAPWASSDALKYQSMHKFINRDIVNPTNTSYWSNAYKGKGVSDDEYICAALAGADWWKDVRCQQLLVLAGEQEALVDSISDFARAYEQGAGSKRIQYYIGEREIHDAPLHPLSDDILDQVGNKKQEGALRSWVKGVCVS